MTALLTQKLTQLSTTVADLKVRVREALAGELSRAISAALGDVVHVLVGGKHPPRQVIDPYRRTPDRWDEDEDRRNDRHNHWSDDEPSYSYSPRRTPSEQATTASEPTIRTAVSAGVHVSRWWLARQGTLLAAAGAGIAVGLIGLFGNTAAKIAVAVVAATAELLSITDVLGAGAAHLADF